MNQTPRVTVEALQTNKETKQRNNQTKKQLDKETKQRNNQTNKQSNIEAIKQRNKQNTRKQTNKQTKQKQKLPCRGDKEANKHSQRAKQPGKKQT